MREILHTSTQSVSYYLRNSAGTAVTPTSLTLALTDEAGSAVTLAGSITLGTPSTLTIASTEVTSTYNYQTLTGKWTGVYSTSTLTDTEDFFVVPRFIENGALATVKDCRDSCGLPDRNSDATVFSLLEAACAIARREVGRKLTIGQVTEARTLYLSDEYLIMADELRSVTSLVDPDDTTLTEDTDYEVITGDDGFVRWIELPARKDGIYTITGTWGFDDPPADARDAIIDIVSTNYKLRHAGLRAGMDEYGVRFPIDLPNSAKAKLNRLKRRRTRSY